MLSRGKDSAVLTKNGVRSRVTDVEGPFRVTTREGVTSRARSEGHLWAGVTLHVAEPSVIWKNVGQTCSWHTRSVGDPSD